MPALPPSVQSLIQRSLLPPLHFSASASPAPSSPSSSPLNSPLRNLPSLSDSDAAANSSWASCAPNVRLQSDESPVARGFLDALLRVTGSSSGHLVSVHFYPGGGSSVTPLIADPAWSSSPSSSAEGDSERSWQGVIESILAKGAGTRSQDTSPAVRVRQFIFILPFFLDFYCDG